MTEQPGRRLGYTHNIILPSCTDPVMSQSAAVGISVYFRLRRWDTLGAGRLSAAEPTAPRRSEFLAAGLENILAAADPTRWRPEMNRMPGLPRNRSEKGEAGGLSCSRWVVVRESTCTGDGVTEVGCHFFPSASPSPAPKRVKYSCHAEWTKILLKIPSHSVWIWDLQHQW